MLIKKEYKTLKDFRLKKCVIDFFGCENCNFKNICAMFNHLFKTIRYGDEEFRRILDYIKEYEQWEEKKNENKKD